MRQRLPPCVEPGCGAHTSSAVRPRMLAITANTPSFLDRQGKEHGSRLLFKVQSLPSRNKSALGVKSNKSAFGVNSIKLKPSTGLLSVNTYAYCFHAKTQEPAC
jgi:hypothetical protein